MYQTSSRWVRQISCWPRCAADPAGRTPPWSAPCTSSSAAAARGRPRPATYHLLYSAPPAIAVDRDDPAGRSKACRCRRCSRRSSGSRCCCRAESPASARASLTIRSMPIFFQCSRTISRSGVLDELAAQRGQVDAERPLPSVRSRNPSASFWVRPALSSSSFACFTSSVDHSAATWGWLYLFVSAAADPGVPMPRKNVSLICSRSIASERPAEVERVEPLVQLGSAS